MGFLNRFIFLVIAVFLIGGSQVFAQSGTASGEPYIPNPPIELPEYGTQEELIYGVYDTVGNIVDNPYVEIQQVYVPWNAGPDARSSAEYLTNEVNSVLERGHAVLVSLEPRSWLGYRGLESENLVEDVIDGWYDDLIIANCEALSAYSPQTIYVRFAHEGNADTVVNGESLFPWQVPAEDYIQMYRYFVIACRDVVGATNVKFMWSPVPNPNAPEYYPGDDVVDLIGLTMLGYDDYDRVVRPNNTFTSFNEFFYRGYSLVDDFGKPIVIAELGVCCEYSQQRGWLRDAYYAMNSREWYPMLYMVLYFNDYDPYLEWIPGYAPDWRICSNLFPPPQFFEQDPTASGTCVEEIGDSRNNGE